jgi:hypothetical protein
MAAPGTRMIILGVTGLDCIHGDKDWRMSQPYVQTVLVLESGPRAIIRNIELVIDLLL